MQLFLLWRYAAGAPGDPAPRRISADFSRVFSPYFSTPPSIDVLHGGRVGLATLELPVPGWKTPFFQDDGRVWARAIDYPITGRSVLRRRGVAFEETTFLPTLCRRLEEDAVPFLREMAPPFALIWGSRDGPTFLQNDGLGQAQLFEYDDGRLWAVTNKVLALTALGVRLRMEPEDWAVRTTLEWFPGTRSGYRNVSYVPPATRFAVTESGVSRRTDDVVSDWVHPETLSRADALELARTSVLDHLQAAAPLWERPWVGLSGGYDSRAIVASLRSLGVPFSARVKGLPSRHDVRLAQELARIGGLDLTVRSDVSLPPDEPEGCRASIAVALRWQGGYMDTIQHKEFFPPGRSLDGGFVNVMGQYGEIARAIYPRLSRASAHPPEEQIERLLPSLLRRRPSFLREGLRNRVVEIVDAMCRVGQQFGLEGLERLDFVNFYERQRRWGSGSLSSQTGVVVTPFLNPDFIRAAYAWRGPGKETSPFHRYIIERNAPDWIGVPFDQDLARDERRRARAAPARPASGDVPRTVGHASGMAEWKEPREKANYDSRLYWETVGKPIIADALSMGGPWTEIFDPDLLAREWLSAPDEAALVILMPAVLAQVAADLRPPREPAAAAEAPLP